MQVFITGATGFLGRALTLRLGRDGYEVSAWVHSPEKAKALRGAEIEPIDASAGAAGLRVALAASDAVIHLAGEPVLPRRWTQGRRKALVESRVGLSDQIVQALAELPVRPQVLVAGSAVGFYGDRPGMQLPEDATKGAGFLADLCAAWEASAEKGLTHRLPDPAGLRNRRVLTVPAPRPGRPGWTAPSPHWREHVHCSPEQYRGK